jgi:hypothetical protein
MSWCSRRRQSFRSACCVRPSGCRVARSTPGAERCRSASSRMSGCRRRGPTWQCCSIFAHAAWWAGRYASRSTVTWQCRRWSMPWPLAGHSLASGIAPTAVASTRARTTAAAGPTRLCVQHERRRRVLGQRGRRELLPTAKFTRYGSSGTGLRTGHVPTCEDRQHQDMVRGAALSTGCRCVDRFGVKSSGYRRFVYPSAQDPRLTRSCRSSMCTGGHPVAGQCPVPTS